MSKVLAFDQSTKLSAYSWFIDGQYIDSGYIDLHKIKDTAERVRTMGIELCKVITSYQPDFIIIEEVAQQSNPLTLKLLARIQGIIIGWAAAYGIKIHIIEPSKWRSALGFKIGKGIKRKELKDQAIQYVKDVYGINLTEDECEAICINEAAHKVFNLCDEDQWGTIEF